MKTKWILRVVLLSIVAVALGNWVVELARSPGSGGGAPADVARADGVTVISFHGTKRCRTCLRIQELAKRTVDEEFAGEVGSGKVRWDEIDYEKAEHAHYVKRYELVSSTVIASRWKDGRETQWKLLDDVWEHVGNEDAFRAYLSQGVRELMEK
jgi:hypothetical protein